MDVFVPGPGASASQAFMFVSMLVGSIIAGSLVAVYAAHCFLVVVHGTAAGNDEVRWPEGTLWELMRDGVWLVGILVLCFLPAGFVDRSLGPHWLTQNRAVNSLLLGGVSIWLFFPVSMLSTMLAHSPWMVFHAAVIVQLLRLAWAAAIFYFASALLVAFTLAAWGRCLFGIRAAASPILENAEGTGLFGTGVAALPVVAACGAASLLIYGRLLGRLAWLVSHVELPGRRRTGKGKKTKQQRLATRAEVTNPWAAPEEKDDADAAEEDAAKQEEYPELKRLGVEGYDRGAQGPPPVPTIDAILGRRDKSKKQEESKQPAKEDDYPELQRRGVKGYGLSSEQVPAPPPVSDIVGEQVLKRHLAERTRTFYAPPHPFFTGVYSFPWYRSNLTAWIKLTLGGTVVGFLLMMMLRFFPV